MASSRKPRMPGLIGNPPRYGFPFIDAVKLLRDKVLAPNGPGMETYPFRIPAIATMDRLPLHPAVTFLVGENGSGKSTLTEAIAVAGGFNAEGGSRQANFTTRNSVSSLHSFIELEKRVVMPKDGYFLRAESFYNLANHLDEIRDADNRGVAKMLHSYGVRSLHELSHGESFLTFLKHRCRGLSLYIFDEPEAALSPSRQMSLLARLHQLTKVHAQFIIATHSPILLSYPHSWIYALTERGMDRVEYRDTEQYQVFHDFLEGHESMLDILLNEEEAQTQAEDGQISLDLEPEINRESRIRTRRRSKGRRRGLSAGLKPTTPQERLELLAGDVPRYGYPFIKALVKNLEQATPPIDEEDSKADFDRYPFTIPAVRALDRLEFHPAVTFLAGENGSGKSTLIEALAHKAGFHLHGGGRDERRILPENPRGDKDEGEDDRYTNRWIHEDQAGLSRWVVLERGVSHFLDGFFLRGESFHSMATQNEADNEGSRSTRYGVDSLHEVSHGESFMAAFLHRCAPAGLYILDEPESALSPTRQMALIARLHELVRGHAQFVIATHSPILLSYPHSWIYVLGETGIERRPYAETEHYTVYRHFLSQPECMLQQLLQND